MTEEIINRIYQEVMNALENGRAGTRSGSVTSYDPNTYMVKVEISPEQVETGWLPIRTSWTGNGFGSYYGPKPGDQAMVAHLEGDIGSGIVIGYVNDVNHRPPAVPSGEAWQIHESGSFLKFHNDGSVEQHVAADFNQTVAGDYNLTVTGKSTWTASQFDMTGDIHETGNVIASGNMTDLSGANAVTVNDLRVAYDAHVHPIPGGGNTGTTDHPV